LVQFYLRDDAAVIAGVVALGEPEEPIVRSRIGASYEELGMGVARSWHLPDKLISSMAAEEGKPRAPRIDSDWLRLFANAGAGLMQSRLAATEEQRYTHFLIMRDRFAEAMRLTERDLRVACDDAIRETLREAAIFGLAGQGGAVLEQLRRLAGLPVVENKSDGGEGAVVPAVLPSQDSIAPVIPPALLKPQVITTEAVRQPIPTVANRPQVVEALANCVQDVTETLVGEFKLNDLLRIILETLYTSLSAHRVLLATRSVQRNSLVGRFGFGDQIDNFVARFVVPLDESSDLFRASLASNTDLVIGDMDAVATKARIPAWYRELATGPSFLLLPIIVDRKIVGLLYADHLMRDGMQMGEREFGLVKTLRNQAILAIRQKTPVA
jgi:hypothetical protein